MSGMAEVLTEHGFHMILPVDLDDVNGAWQVECNCNSEPIQGSSFMAAEAAFAAHQAAMLTAAGFGSVSEARTVAYEDAAENCGDLRTAAWIRFHAAGVRPEG